MRLPVPVLRTVAILTASSAVALIIAGLTDRAWLEPDLLPTLCIVFAITQWFGLAAKNLDGTDPLYDPREASAVRVATFGAASAAVCFILGTAVALGFVPLELAVGYSCIFITFAAVALGGPYVVQEEGEPAPKLARARNMPFGLIAVPLTAFIVLDSTAGYNFAWGAAALAAASIALLSTFRGTVPALGRRIVA